MRLLLMKTERGLPIVSSQLTSNDCAQQPYCNAVEDEVVVTWSTCQIEFKYASCCLRHPVGMQHDEVMPVFSINSVVVMSHSVSAGLRSGSKFIQEDIPNFGRLDTLNISDKKMHNEKLYKVFPPLCAKKASGVDRLPVSKYENKRFE